MKCFIDTNILIDILSGRDGSASSKRLFALAFLQKVELSMSALSLVNAIYICKRLKLDIDQTKEKLMSISSFVNIQDLSGQTAIDCLHCQWKDYEDATQHLTALASDCDYIVTHNLKDFTLSQIPVLSPDAVISLI